MSAVLHRARGWIAGHLAIAYAAGLSTVLLIGIVDLKTGLLLSVSPFYLAPIAAAAWWADRRLARALVVASTGVWYLAEYGWDQHFPWIVSVWNALARAVVFIAIAELIGRIRERNVRLAELSRQVDSLYRREWQLSRMDMLSGLLNRRAFEEAMEAAVQRAAHNSRHPLAVAFLDLDDFKAVNDQRGHAAGDEVLVSVAAALRASVRGGDVAARVGGDEFAIVFEQTGETSAAGMHDRLAAVCAAVRIQSGAFDVGVSAGLVVFDEAPISGHLALAKADAAMYAAKRRRKGTITLWRVHRDGRCETVTTAGEPSTDEQTVDEPAIHEPPAETGLPRTG